MANRREAGCHALLFLIFAIIMSYGCAGAPTIQETVVTEYLLNQAGFQPYQANMETPKTQALLNALPKGQITTYMRNGTVYHAYPDEKSNTLYVGDEAAYRKYLSLAEGQKVCRRVEAQDSAGFWGCFAEFQKSGRPPR